ncbi:MAG: Hint domain-containing protein [Alphaproteobacteria bacterium]|nr:Hint domain-containing protein [Alphaproteobacteria bacterium]
MPTPTPTTLVNFDVANGADPESGLIADAARDLFGTTLRGGANGDGTIFELVNTGSGYAITPTPLASFNGDDGSLPQAGLIADTAGDLFGTATKGGAHGDGTVFELVKTSTGYANTPIPLVSFNGADGANPVGGLVADAAGDLFGTTEFGGGSNNAGTVFEIVKTTTGYASTPTTLVSFNVLDGSFPEAPLIIDAAGDLFGTTSQAGANGNGTVFELANTAGSYPTIPDTLVSFDGSDGSEPEAGLIMDGSGNLFGTTFAGGANQNYGTVFEIPNTPNGYATTPTTLVSFDFTHGKQPAGSVIMDADGNLFGTAETGGQQNDGTLFEVAKTATGYATLPTTLVDFSDTGAAFPEAGLFADSAGDLFGTTESGGENSDGTVFEVTDSGFVPCFCRGTMILTPSGEVAVERLRSGDKVVTLAGEEKPIAWIGSGRHLITAGNQGLRPIIVRRDAIAEGVPCRDLYVTKAHSLYLDEILIPVECLVNGRSVLWDDTARAIEFYHVELPSHDVLIADGAPAESYKEDGNRDLFHNIDGPVVAATETAWFAPVHNSGPVVDRVWRRLWHRSSGGRPALTSNPELHLVADGTRIEPVEASGGFYRFLLEGRPGELRIVSHSAVPAEIGRNLELRRLGVALRSIVLRAAGVSVALNYDSPLLCDGFHEPEPDPAFCWTDGDARMPGRALLLFEGPLEVALEIGATIDYPRAQDEGAALRDAA